MLFNSSEFLIFFPIVTILYYLIPIKFRWIHLLAASCIFYAAFIPSYLLILLLLIVVDFFAGQLIEKKKDKKKWLLLSIIANLSILFFFKYYNFFIGNINTLTGSNFILFHLALPIGISFHTFQSLSYTIEVYKGKQKAITHFGYYALYVMFYPQLVAGPIERPQHLFPQLFNPKKFRWKNIYEGIRLMIWGFVKKVVIADRLSDYVDIVFKNPASANTASIWLAVFFFGIQIYADFSGYSDIAIGAAKTMGFDLMINFNRPYVATNIRAFWKRWHISLSSWFRDYVYIPLGGSRKSKWRNKFNLLITFILSGFWHGAAFTFIIWGLLHAVYVICYDSIDFIRKRIKMPLPVAWFFTWIAVNIAWIFFRASSLKIAAAIIAKGMLLRKFNLTGIYFAHGESVAYGKFSMMLIACTIFYMFILEKLTTPQLKNLNAKKYIDMAFFAINVSLILFFGVFNRTNFIYFQF
jgi:alginate O-acetyltransferase complex protein AlgI